jgi:hypothetical protein
MAKSRLIGEPIPMRREPAVDMERPRPGEPGSFPEEQSPQSEARRGGTEQDCKHHEDREESRQQKDRLEIVLKRSLHDPLLLGGQHVFVDAVVRGGVARVEGVFGSEFRAGR